MSTLSSRLTSSRKLPFGHVPRPRQAIVTNTPTTLGAKLLVACTALRAYRKGLAATVEQCFASLGNRSPGASTPILRSVSISVRSVTLLRALRETTSALTRRNFLALITTQRRRIWFFPCASRVVGGQEAETYHPCHLERRRCAHLRAG